MVQLRGGTDTAIRLDQLNLADIFTGSFQDASGTSFTVAGSGGVTTEFSGNGFTYDGAGAPAGGTIRGLDYKVNGALNLSINGLASDAGQLYGDATGGSAQAALDEIFSG